MSELTYSKVYALASRFFPSIVYMLMSDYLSPYRLRKARRVYDGFNILNALSFLLVSGNLLTLFAMRLGAGPSTIGVLNAFQYVSFFFMPLGKRLVSRFRIITVFSSAWFARYVVMLPLVAGPIVFRIYGMEPAIAVLLFAAFAFNAGRGAGMIGNNPVLNMLATGTDRGGYMIQIQIINSLVAMVGSLGVALLLGQNPPLMVYGIIVGVGIITGIGSSLFVARLPEPYREDKVAHPGKRSSSGFFKTASKAFSDRGFRIFFIVFFILSFASSMARPFIVVYSRDVYAQGDGAITLLSVAAGLGSLAMGMLTRLLVDRVGAKPLYLVYAAAAALSLIPAVVSPGLTGPLVAAIFLILLQFVVNFGFAGTEGIAQTYFFGLMKPEDVLDLGILYYIVYGVAGAAGSALGGIFLDTLTSQGVGIATSYRIFFSFLIILVLIALALGSRLIPLGALSLRGTLGVIFSFRDLRAIGILHRLERSVSPGEEAALLDALHDTPTLVGERELLDRLRSPRLSVRLEALRAIEALDSLTPEAEEALLTDAAQNPYTTAYASARILGAKGVRSAIPLLRASMSSDDYMLAGEAMVALSKLGDPSSLETIQRILGRSRNPRLLIRGATALEIYGDPSSLSCLLDLMRREQPPPYLRDEIVLSLAVLLGFRDDFYRAYRRFLDDPDMALDLVMDEIDGVFEKSRSGHSKSAVSVLEQRKSSLREAARRFIADGEGAPLSRWIHERSVKHPDLPTVLLAEAALDPDLVCYDRFRLLLAFWAASAF